MRSKFFNTQIQKEKVFLVGVKSKASQKELSIDDSLDELSRLVKTAGGETVGRLFQNMESPSPTYYLGKGKLNELLRFRETTHYDTVAFDDELSPRQQKSLEEIVAAKVIDRTVLILDIFAKQARTREGKLQVELAQHKYLLPRLVGQWSHLERLGGGIGTRGPGESQLETDRRLIRKRINRLQSKIDEIRQNRNLYRKRRKASRIPIIAIVGYTNAGKSTLFNALSKADVLVEDKFFSTLDPVTRRLALPDGQVALITDTVGFIHHLPSLIATAFKATLEELDEADLILHVIDITHKDAATQCIAVDKILDELGLIDKPKIIVFNKLDLNLSTESELEALTTIPQFEEKFVLPTNNMALISACKGWGISGLLEKIYNKLSIKSC